MRIAASPEFVHAYVATPSHWPLMNAACIGVEHTRAPAVRVDGTVAERGDRVVQYLRQGDADTLTVWHWEIVEARLGREFAMVERDSGMRIHWRFAAADGATDTERSSGQGTDVDRAAAAGVRTLVEDAWARRGAVVARDRGAGASSEYYMETNEQVVGAGESGGAHAAMRVTVHPESAPPLHIHTREDEAWTVLSGELRFWFGGRTIGTCETVDVRAGGYVFGPRFIPHTFTTLTPESEVTITNSPGRIEGYFDAVGAGDVRDDAAHTELFEEYGLIVFTDQSPI